MEKELVAAGYWLGLICTVVALIFRISSAFDVNALTYLPLRATHWLLTFLARCRAIFPVVDCELVPDCKILAQSWLRGRDYMPAGRPDAEI
jgi:hypothetical protein